MSGESTILYEDAWKGGTMKLAEALAERSDCQIRIEEMKKPDSFNNAAWP
jgi:hypothetical protein